MVRIALISPEAWFRVGDSDDARAVERSVGALRVFLASAGLLAVWIDPTQPAAYGRVAYAMLAGYVGLAILFLMIGRSGIASRAPRAFGITTHILDIVVAATVMLSTEGPDSPYFVFLSFPMLVAAYRWGLRETLATAITAVALLGFEWFLLDAGIAQSIREGARGSFDANRVIMRAAYLVIAGFLIGYLGEQEKQRRREAAAMALLIGRARADAGLGGTPEALLGALARLFRSPRALLIAQEKQGSRAHLISAEPERSGHPSIVTATELDEYRLKDYLFDMPGESCYAVSLGDGGEFSVLALDDHGRRMATRRTELSEAFVQAHPCSGMLVLPVASRRGWSARVLVFDPDVGLDREGTLRFAQRLVREMGPSIHQVSLLQRVRSRAEAIERARLSRELHDGAIQSLVAADLQLAVLSQKVAPALPESVGDIAGIQTVLRDEVQNMRELTQEMKLGIFEADAEHLLQDASTMVERFERQTGIAAHFVGDMGPVDLTARACHEILRILHESLVNIRRHSGARNVLVQAALGPQYLKLAIGDDGKGFPFTGRLSHRELEERQEGPAVIRERVQSLGWKMTVESRPGRGARIELLVPFNVRA